jgi:hypothetical protein
MAAVLAIFDVMKDLGKTLGLEFASHELDPWFILHIIP